MAAYAFEAVDAAGKSTRGVIEAASAAAARQTLRQRRLLPVSVAASAVSSARTAGPAAGLSALLRPRVGSKALAAVTRQLSTLIGSDIRIEEALRIVARQHARGPAGPILGAIRASVVEGRSLAAALAEHPVTFPAFYRASIAAGERSGRLPEVLNHLTDFVENRERARRKVQLALLYPALLAVVSGLMIVLMLVYVVPDIVKVFVSRGAELPLLTRGLIGLSGFVQTWGWLVGLAVLAAMVAGRQWLRVPANRMTLARWIATRPPTRRFSRQLNAARFAGSLATLVNSDVPLVEAVQAAAAVTPNAHVRARAEHVAARLRQGSGLGRAMTEADVFPDMLLAIVASGESGGRLGPSLERASRDLDQEMESLTTALVALVEPMILILMGGVVLLLMLAILMPIVNLNSLAGM